jgi:putative transposase
VAAAIVGAQTRYLSLDKDCPDARPIMPRTVGKVVGIPKVGGLHHRYERLAA